MERASAFVSRNSNRKATIASDLLHSLHSRSADLDVSLFLFLFFSTLLFAFKSNLQICNLQNNDLECYEELVSILGGGVGQQNQQQQIQQKTSGQDCINLSASNSTISSCSSSSLAHHHMLVLDGIGKFAASKKTLVTKEQNGQNHLASVNLNDMPHSPSHKLKYKQLTSGSSLTTSGDPYKKDVIIKKLLKTIDVMNKEINKRDELISCVEKENNVLNVRLQFIINS